MSWARVEGVTSVGGGPVEILSITFEEAADPNLVRQASIIVYDIPYDPAIVPLVTAITDVWFDENVPFRLASVFVDPAEAQLTVRVMVMQVITNPTSFIDIEPTDTSATPFNIVLFGEQ